MCYWGSALTTGFFVVLSREAPSKWSHQLFVFCTTATCTSWRRVRPTSKVALRQPHQLNGVQPHVVFGGDAYFPSLLTQSTLGGHMVPILNAIHKDCGGVSCLGNHDLDGGVPIAEKWISRSTFPWLVANFKDKHTDLPIPSNCKEYVIQPYPLSIDPDFKIGYVGVIESEWTETLGCVDPDDVIFEEQLQCLERLCPKMRSEGASIIICVSHQRVPRDRMLCEKAAHLIDEVLGGHDHHYEVSEPIGPQGLHYVKSGTDFRSFTVVDLLILKIRLTSAASGRNVGLNLSHQLCSVFPAHFAI